MPETEVTLHRATECPHCGATLAYYADCDKEGEHGEGHCSTPEWCAEHGHSAHCCNAEGKRGPFFRTIGVEYDYTHPERYDGVSEWMCPFCQVREGRWSGRVLGEGESEPRFGGRR